MNNLLFFLDLVICWASKPLNYFFVRIYPFSLSLFPDQILVSAIQIYQIVQDNLVFLLQLAWVRQIVSYLLETCFCAVRCHGYCSLFVFNSQHNIVSKDNPSGNTNNNPNTSFVSYSRLVFHSSMLALFWLLFRTAPEQLPCELWTL